MGGLYIGYEIVCLLHKFVVLLMPVQNIVGDFQCVYQIAPGWVFSVEDFFNVFYLFFYVRETIAVIIENWNG